MITGAIAWIAARWGLVKAAGWVGALAWGKSRAASVLSGQASQATIAAVIAGCVVIAFASGAVLLMFHDKRVSRETRAACIAEHVADALRAEIEATRTAIRLRDMQLKERHADLEAAETRISQMEKANADLRARAPGGADVVFPADDPWLLAKQPDRATRAGHR